MEHIDVTEMIQDICGNDFATSLRHQIESRMAVKALMVSRNKRGCKYSLLDDWLLKARDEDLDNVLKGMQRYLPDLR